MENIVFDSWILTRLATILIAVLPWTELRIAIPIAIQAWKMPPVEAFTLSLAGNLVPMFAILYLFESFERFMTVHFSWARSFFSWLHARTKKKFAARRERYGDIALCIFVMIPIPGTGVWTGSLAISLFGIKRSHALLYITIGAALSGLIVTALTLGVKKGFNV